MITYMTPFDGHKVLKLERPKAADPVDAWFEVARAEQSEDSPLTWDGGDEDEYAKILGDIDKRKSPQPIPLAQEQRELVPESADDQPRFNYQDAMRIAKEHGLRTDFESPAPGSWITHDGSATPPIEDGVRFEYRMARHKDGSEVYMGGTEASGFYWRQITSYRLLQKASEPAVEEGWIEGKPQVPTGTKIEYKWAGRGSEIFYATVVNESAFQQWAACIAYRIAKE